MGKRPRVSAAVLVLLASVGLLMVAAACGGGVPPVPENAQPYSFTTEDGVLLRGHLLGSGDTALVLSHMRPADETSWFEFAGELANRGFLVLTFNFRGYSPSEGSKEVAKMDRDVEAALKSLRDTSGVRRVVLIGASMGGTASLKVAARQQVAGVVTLSAPVEIDGLSVERDIEQVTASKLFLASQGDAPARDSARFLYSRSSEPKQSVLRTGRAHGTDMLKGGQGGLVKQAIVQFLERIRQQ